MEHSDRRRHEHFVLSEKDLDRNVEQTAGQIAAEVGRRLTESARR